MSTEAAKEEVTKEDGKEGKEGKPEGSNSKSSSKSKSKPKADSSTALQQLLEKLESNENEAKKLREEIRNQQQARLVELEAAIEAENERHSAAIESFNAELTPLQTALGVKPLLDDLNLDVGVESPTESGEDSDIVLLGASKPKNLSLGRDENGEPYDDSFWEDYLMQWPFENESSVPSSLEGYVALVLYNANGSPLAKSVIEAAVKAMGYESKSQNFSATVAVPLGKLKKEGIIQSAGHGLYAMKTEKGKKWVEALISETDAMYAEDEEEEVEETETVVAKSVEDGFLMAISLSDGRVAAKDLGKYLAQVGCVGYDKEEVRSAILKTIKEGYVVSEKNENSESVFRFTEEGAKRGNVLAAEAAR